MANRARIALIALALGGGALPSPANARAKGVAVQPMTEPVIWLAKRVIASRDNRGLPFIVIDKVAAELFVFDAKGQFVGATPALLGVTRGDDTVPGIGDRELSAIAPAERTTPAGRFLASFGPAQGHDNKVLWVDYASSLALHPVITTNKKERRLQRLKSPSAEDNRITYGCINVPTLFYKNVISGLFGSVRGVVYILPETKPIEAVFPKFRK